MTEQTTEKVKRPASQYYWGDWWKDKGLHSCSLSARGLWHEMNCLMHEGEPYGHLTLNGRPMSIAQLANQCRITPAICKKLLDELTDAGVPSTSDAGAIFSRRMVRDETVRNARAAGGKAGAEHGIKGADAGSKGGRPKNAKGGEITPLLPGLEPPPSSSSSSSSSPSGLKEANASSSSAKPPTIPSCPHLKLIDLFGQKLPTLAQPKAEFWDGKPADNMRARWKWLLTATRSKDQTRYATTEAEAIEWFGRFFDFVSDSDFLMARTGDFKCTLQWLMVKDNFAKVVQGNYKNKDSQ